MPVAAALSFLLHALAVMALILLPHVRPLPPPAPADAVQMEFEPAAAPPADTAPRPPPCGARAAA
ncbi:MAG TPA: hypothetical protein VGT81_17830 [Casimicrobiaceae bacterium]|nr:hypothetical protein [Casimicrobiaceae bacterium]